MSVEFGIYLSKNAFCRGPKNDQIDRCFWTFFNFLISQKIRLIDSKTTFYLSKNAFCKGPKMIIFETF